jgi:protein gp37
MGGETGQGSRMLFTHWAQGVRAFCEEHKLPLFFKQWGTAHMIKLRTIHEGTWQQFYDAQLQLPMLDGKVFQQFPKVEHIFQQSLF